MRTHIDTSRLWRMIAVIATTAVVVSMMFYATAPKAPTRLPALTAHSESPSVQSAAMSAPNESAALATQPPVEPMIANEQIVSPVTLADLEQDPDPEIREEAQALAELLAQEAEE